MGKLVKVFVDPKIHNIIQNWDVEHADLEKRIAAAPILVMHKDMQINFNNHYVAYYKKKKDCIKFTIKEYSGEQIVKGKIVTTPEGERDYNILYDFDERHNNTLKKNFESVTQLVKMVAYEWVVVNNLFIYGNIVEGGGGENYSIREYDDKIYLIEGGSHRSPNGIFSVRGHFRKYKNGKIIWIDEYLKGVK